MPLGKVVSPRKVGGENTEQYDNLRYTRYCVTLFLISLFAVGVTNPLS